MTDERVRWKSAPAPSPELAARLRHLLPRPVNRDEQDREEVDDELPTSAA